MAFTEQTVYDKIEILEDGQIQLRLATKILRDGVEIARTYHREVLDPSIGLAKQYTDPRIESIAATVWTPDVVDAREAVVAAQTLALSAPKDK